MTGADVLTPEERSALLDDAPAPPPAPGAVRDYLLGRGAAGPAPAGLHHLFERYTAGLTEAVGALVEQGVEVLPLPRTHVTGLEFVQALPLRVVLHALVFDPPWPPAWIAVDGELAGALVERLFGGSGRRPARAAAQRELGATELRMAGAVLRAATDTLGPALGAHTPLAARLGAALDPRLPGALDAAAPLLACCFEIRAGALGGLLRLGLPAAMVGALVEAPAPQEADAAWRAALRAGVDATALLTRAVLAEVRVPLRRVLALRPGDVLELDGAERVRVDLDGRALFVGELGATRKHLAVRITGRAGAPTP